MAAEKAALRRRLLAAARAAQPGQRAAAGRALRDAVLALPEAQMAGTVAAYYSIGTEPDTHGLRLRAVEARQLRAAAAAAAGRRPGLGLLRGPRLAAAGPARAAEPSEPPRGPDAVASADLVLVPALAVDRAACRLGRGGGCYDRALARVGAAGADRGAAVRRRAARRGPGRRRTTSGCGWSPGPPPGITRLPLSMMLRGL